MFFLFKTKASFGPAFLDLQSVGDFFIHDTGIFENKICLFGKVMAVAAVCLAYLRLFFLEKKEYVLKGTIAFDLLCVALAITMNINAFIYIVPLIIAESYIIYELI